MVRFLEECPTTYEHCFGEMSKETCDSEVIACPECKSPTSLNLETPRLTERAPRQYAGHNIARIEPLVDERLLDFLNILKPKWASSPENYKAFDIGKRIEYLVIDTISNMIFGKEFGYVASDNDLYQFLATIRQGNRFSYPISVLYGLTSSLLDLAKVPYIGSWRNPTPRDSSGVGVIMGVHGPGSTGSNMPFFADGRDRSFEV